MHKNTEKKRGLNALDVLLTIIVIAVIAIAVANVVRANPSVVSGGDMDISYVIKVTNVPDTLTDNIKESDKLYDNKSGQLLGEVTSVSYKQSQKLGYNSSGSEIFTPIDGLTDIEVTLKVSVWSEDEVLNIDGFRIAVGMEISFHSPNISVTGTCTSITEL